VVDYDLALDTLNDPRATSRRWRSSR
jgi:hypothetical protein